MYVRPFTHKGLIVAAFLVGLTLASYWRTRELGFLNYDDNLYITDNVHIKDGLSRAGFAWSMTTLYQNWHPVTWISHAIDCQLYGLNPAGHHLTNTLIHILNVVLLFVMLSSVTGAIWRSGFVAGLFAVHPLNVESVAWVAERKNVLCTLFFILTIWAYSWYARRPGWRRYLVVLALFVLGLMAKSMLVSLPFVLLLMDYWPLGRFRPRVPTDGSAGDDGNRIMDGGSQLCPPQNIPRIALEKAPLLILAAGVCVITVLAQTGDGAVASTVGYPMSVRLENSLFSYAKYLQQMVWPGGLSLIYPFPDRLLPAWQVLLAAAVLVTVSVYAVARAKRFRYLIVGWLWYLGTLVPVIGLVQIGSQARADRYAYIPLIGIFIAVVWRLAESTRLSGPAGLALGATGICILVAFTVVSNRQTGYWRDDVTLMRHAVSVSQNNYIARNMLATDLILDGKPDEAIAEFSKITAADPVYDKAQNTMGMIFVQTGRFDEAISHFKTAIEFNPRYSDAYNRLGAVFLDEGKIDEAIPLFYKALEFSPNHPSAWANLGAAFEAKGDMARALDHYGRALQITVGRIEDANLAEALDVAARINFRMGDLLARNGKRTEAMDRYLEVLRYSPGDQAAAQRLKSLRQP